MFILAVDSPEKNILEGALCVPLRPASDFLSSRPPLSSSELVMNINHVKSTLRSEDGNVEECYRVCYLFHCLSFFEIFWQLLCSCRVFLFA